MLCASYKQSRRISILNIYYLFYFILLYFIFVLSLVLLFRFAFFDFNRVSIIRLLFVFLFLSLSLSSCFQTWTVYIQCNIHKTRRSSRSVEEELRRESFDKTAQRISFVVPSRVVVNQTLKSSLIRIHDHVLFWFYNKNQDLVL